MSKTREQLLLDSQRFKALQVRLLFLDRILTIVILPPMLSFLLIFICIFVFGSLPYQFALFTINFTVIILAFPISCALLIPGKTMMFSSLTIPENAH